MSAQLCKPVRTSHWQPACIVYSSRSAMITIPVRWFSLCDVRQNARTTDRQLYHRQEGRQTISEQTGVELQVHVQSYWRFRDLLEAAPDGILEVDQDGTIVLLNAAAEQMFGYRREELLGQLIEVLVPESLRRRHRQHREKYVE